MATPRPGVPDELREAAAGLSAPCAVLDLDALEANADAMLERAGGVPIRVATKSIRCVEVVAATLRRPGFAGALAFTVPEALWLLRRLEADTDVLVAYPCVDPAALRALAADPEARRRVALVADDAAQIDRLAAAIAGAGAAGVDGPPIRVWPDVDCSLRLGSIHVGARRSPLRDVDDTVALARRVLATPGLEIGGLMFYDAQVAGLPDRSAAVRAMKRRSVAELATRRARIVRAVRRLAPVPAVNAGGTGSLHLMGPDPHVTELAAGSGLYAPHIFDDYLDLRARPALYFGLDVVRRPAPGIVTAFGGGYVASGQAGRSRWPRPVFPRGARLVGSEGAGEVQTPLRLPRGSDVGVGDRVWFRPAKAGEVLERFDVVHLARAGRIVGAVPTYRGEGACFG